MVERITPTRSVEVVGRSPRRVAAAAGAGAFALWCIAVLLIPGRGPRLLAGARVAAL